MEQIHIKHELKSVLAKRIVFSSSMTGAIVYGGQRIGKSSYCLQVMADIYNQDWDKVLGYTFFKIEDLIAALRKAISDDYIIPCILLDDAAIGGSKQLYFTNKNLTQYLSALTDVMGTATKGLLLSTPNPDALLKTLRGYEFFRIKITKQTSGYDRVATGYRSVLLPSGTRLIKKEFKDPFNAIIKNDEAYARYSTMRKSYLTDALDNLESLLEGRAGLKEQAEDEV